MSDELGPVTLREVRDEDLQVFYAQQMDQVAARMAAFAPRDAGDPDAFIARWRGQRADPDNRMLTIIAGETVAGHIVAFTRDGLREVGYWVDRALWGRGIGSAALAQFLDVERTRPLYARVVSDNVGSRRIAERCGFVEIAREKMHDEIRAGEIEEIVYELA